MQNSYLIKISFTTSTSDSIIWYNINSKIVLMHQTDTLKEKLWTAQLKQENTTERNRKLPKYREGIRMRSLLLSTYHSWNKKMRLKETEITKISRRNKNAIPSPKLYYRYLLYCLVGKGNQKKKETTAAWLPGDLTDTRSQKEDCHHTHARPYSTKRKNTNAFTFHTAHSDERPRRPSWNWKFHLHRSLHRCLHRCCRKTAKLKRTSAPSTSNRR